MNDASAEMATIEVSASHPRFAVPMYMGTHLEVEIDGEVSEFPWGRHSIDVTPAGTRSA